MREDYRVLAICDSWEDGLLIETILAKKRNDIVTWKPYSPDVLAETYENPPHLIIIQTLSHEHNPVEVYEEFKQQTTTKDIPILFWGVPPLGVERIKHLNEAYVTVPITAEDLIKVRDTLLTDENLTTSGSETSSEDS